MNIILKIKIKITAFKVLKKEVSMKEIIFLVKEMESLKGKGEPWKDLPNAETNKDFESRELIGEAILLYRALQIFKDKTEAEKIVRNVITRSAVAQLGFLIPTVKKTKLLKMIPEERSLFFKGIVDKFPNAEYTLVEESEEKFKFYITKCRLVELIINAGHPELSDAFCSGDGVYFSECQPDIEFFREEMLGKGCEKCDFEFRLRK